MYKQVAIVSALLPFLCVTTIDAVKSDSRVIGGDVAKLGDFPWQAAIHYSGIYICAGTLIDLKHVITTYECLDPYKDFPSLLTVHLGVLVAADTTNSTNGVKVKMGTFFNHLAILEIKPVEDISEHKKAIYYQDDEDLQTFDHVFLSGWGMDDNTLYHELRSVELSVDKSSLLCVGLNHFCTFGYNIHGQHVGGCKWDVGSGLVRFNENLGNDVLVGVVTYGSCDNPKETTYSSIYNQKTWIDAQLNS